LDPLVLRYAHLPGLHELRGATERWPWALEEEQTAFIQRALELGIISFDIRRCLLKWAERIRGWAGRCVILLPGMRCDCHQSYFELGTGPNDRGLSRKQYPQLDRRPVSSAWGRITWILYQIHRWDYEPRIEERWKPCMMWSGPVSPLTLAHLRCLLAFCQSLFTSDLHGWTRSFLCSLITPWLTGRRRKCFRSARIRSRRDPLVTAGPRAADPQPSKDGMNAFVLNRCLRKRLYSTKT